LVRVALRYILAVRGGERGHADTGRRGLGRADDEGRRRPARRVGGWLWHVGGCREYTPRRPAGAEEPGRLPAHADGATAGGRAVSCGRRAESAGDPREGGSRCDGAAR